MDRFDVAYTIWKINTAMWFGSIFISVLNNRVVGLDVFTILWFIYSLILIIALGISNGI